MNLELFREILEIDSTSGKEGSLADFLAERLLTDKCKVEIFKLEDGTKNLLFSWGQPKVIFCTHLDTVPPYIAPTFSEYMVRGRGTCDAKGQIFAMYKACLELERKGYEGYGLLLLAGEEIGSKGAKAFDKTGQGAEYLVVGEPTDNAMASASKGTKAFEISFEGKAAHSGYSEYGESAVEHFLAFSDALRSIVFPNDEVLGKTTWNIGELHSNNLQNILSDQLSCKLYFRTTFASDTIVSNVMKNIAGPKAKLRFGKNKAPDGSDLLGNAVAPWQRAMTVKALGGDTPTKYTTLEGFPNTVVAFGSDAPHLSNFDKKILCGPGSILVAHTDNEHILLADLKKAVKNYIEIFEQVKCHSEEGYSPDVRN